MRSRQMTQHPRQAIYSQMLLQVTVTETEGYPAIEASYCFQCWRELRQAAVCRTL